MREHFERAGLAHALAKPVYYISARAAQNWDGLTMRAWPVARSIFDAPL